MIKMNSERKDYFTRYINKLCGYIILIIYLKQKVKLSYASENNTDPLKGIYVYESGSPPHLLTESEVINFSRQIIILNRVTDNYQCFSMKIACTCLFQISTKWKITGGILC